MQKVHLVIPARYKSTRLPGKPLLPIHGQPMILWTAKKALHAHTLQLSYIPPLILCFFRQKERL